VFRRTGGAALAVTHGSTSETRISDLGSRIWDLGSRCFVEEEFVETLKACAVEDLEV
jgi:hypothetical protein